MNNNLLVAPPGDIIPQVRLKQRHCLVLVLLWLNAHRVARTVAMQVRGHVESNV